MKNKGLVIGLVVVSIAAALILLILPGRHPAFVRNNTTETAVRNRVEKALLLIESGKFDEAQPLLEENLNAGGFDERSSYWLSFILVQGGLYDKAFAVAKPFVEKARDPQLLTDLGSLFAIHGFESMAMVCYVKALKEDERFIRAYIELGKVYGNQEKFLQAIGIWQDALRFDPHNEEIQGLIKQGYALWDERPE